MNAFEVRTHVFTLFAINRKENNFKICIHIESHWHWYMKNLLIDPHENIDKRIWCVDVCSFWMLPFLFVQNSYSAAGYILLIHCIHILKGRKKMYCIVSGISRRVFILIMRMYVDILSAWYDTKICISSPFLIIQSDSKHTVFVANQNEREK